MVYTIGLITTHANENDVFFQPLLWMVPTLTPFGLRKNADTFKLKIRPGSCCGSFFKYSSTLKNLADYRVADYQ